MRSKKFMSEFIHLFIVATMSNNNIVLNLLVVALTCCLLQRHMSHFYSNGTYHANLVCNCMCNKSRFFWIHQTCFKTHDSSMLHWNHLKIIEILWISSNPESLPAAAADSAGLPASLTTQNLEKKSHSHHTLPYLNKGVQRQMGSKLC